MLSLSVLMDADDAKDADHGKQSGLGEQSTPPDLGVNCLIRLVWV